MLTRNLYLGIQVTLFMFIMINAVHMSRIQGSGAGEPLTMLLSVVLPMGIEIGAMFLWTMLGFLWSSYAPGTKRNLVAGLMVLILVVHAAGSIYTSKMVMSLTAAQQMQTEMEDSPEWHAKRGTTNMIIRLSNKLGDRDLSTDDAVKLAESAKDLQAGMIEMKDGYSATRTAFEKGSLDLWAWLIAFLIWGIPVAISLGKGALQVASPMVAGADYLSQQLMGDAASPNADGRNHNASPPQDWDKVLQKAAKLADDNGGKLSVAKVKQHCGVGQANAQRILTHLQHIGKIDGS